MGRLRAKAREIRETYREKGFKGTIRHYGWKLVAVIFCYYLVRDLTLYVLIPYIVAKHLLEP